VLEAPELASDFDSDFGVEVVSDLASAFASPPFAFASPFALAAGLVPELLKSVAYQPLPLSWKPAAETSLLKRALPQTGQSVSGESESFCKASSLCPQSLQRYS